jgi:hypothetical protein
VVESVPMPPRAHLTRGADSTYPCVGDHPWVRALASVGAEQRGWRRSLIHLGVEPG